MRTMRPGSRGPAVELLQLALNRAGYGELETDGIFGALTAQALRRFQSARKLVPDGIAGQETHRALLPYYTGYTVYRISRGDTLYSIAQSFSSSVEAIELANPGTVPTRLEPGTSLVIPLGFPVVPSTISWSSALVGYCVRGLAVRYPFLSVGEIGKSVMGRPLWRMSLGSGERRVLYNASHHANEWICTPLLMKFTEELAKAFASGGQIYGYAAAEILANSLISIVPALNPDGIDLVTGELQGGEFYRQATKIGADYPQFPFPSGWKANIRGTDLNLQYPAGWEQAKANKYAQGIVSPAPGAYVGPYPLSAPESRAMYDYTLSLGPELILAYHTQGEVIYWKYEDLEPPGAREIGEILASASGYTLEDTPYASGLAGYKDWFIDSFFRPGYTIEAGQGINPLPLSQFDEIYKDNLGILVLAALSE